jgi:hypothetical protein
LIPVAEESEETVELGMRAGDSALGMEAEAQARVSSPPDRPRPPPVGVGGLHTAGLLLPLYKQMNRGIHRLTPARMTISDGLAVSASLWNGWSTPLPT